MQLEQPEDFVIATGSINSLQDFVAAAFSAVGLDWTSYVEFDNTLTRPSEIAFSLGNAGKAQKLLGWRAKLLMPDVVRAMVEHELTSKGTGVGDADDISVI